MDVAIAGAGPAALSLAAELCERGARVTVVAPDPEAPWTNNYGAFLDELVGLGLQDAVERVWSSTVVHTTGDARALGRAYARVDRQKLRRTLIERCGGALELRSGRVVRLSRAGSRMALHCEDGAQLDAALVVDARGAIGHRTRSAQVAYGIDVRVAPGTFDPEVATLMDFRTDAWPQEKSSPTFLYALPLGPDRVFLEETSLVAAPPVSLDVLQARLRLRLERRGIRVDDVREVERCFIPMDVPPPAADAEIIPFGAAAGFVHPATGYSLVEALRRAPAVAQAMVNRRSASAALDAMWPTRTRRAHTLYALGREVLQDLDSDQTAQFFEAFFRVESSQWSGFLSRTAGPWDLSRAMMGVFRGLGWSMRSRLLRAVLAP